MYGTEKEVHGVYEIKKEMRCFLIMREESRDGGHLSKLF